MSCNKNCKECDMKALVEHRAGGKECKAEYRRRYGEVKVYYKSVLVDGRFIDVPDVEEEQYEQLSLF